MSRSEFSPARLSRMRDILSKHVESGDLPGLVTLVHRCGETQVEAIGKQSLDSEAPMRRDTIFRIASMTKPILAVAALILVEECVLRLDDPVDTYLPELANRRVLREIDSPLTDTVPANRAITVRDLLTLRLGIGMLMRFTNPYPIQQAMEKTGIATGPYPPTLPPEEWMDRLGTLPLIHQPGERWLYHTGFEVLGVLLARASGQPLEDFLRERIFAPLGMKDTGFFVPEDRRDRLADCYGTNFETGNFELFDAARGGFYSLPPVFASEVVSTVDDYLAFAQMLLGRGQHNNVRLLSRASVELMTTDQLAPEQKSGPDNFLGANRGWGFGVSVVNRRDELAATPGRFGWDGGYGTSAYTDPAEKMIGILMTQRLWTSPVPPPVHRDFWTCAYAALQN